MQRMLMIAVAAAGVLSAQSLTDRSWSILTAGIHDQKADCRTKAARALGLITSNDKARELAEKALADPKPDVRAAAADSLGQMGAKSSVSKLIETIRADKDAGVVFSAASALFTLGDPRAYDFYYAVLTGERKTGDSLLDSQMKMLKDPKAVA
jgi:HEAT repeat protein